MESDPLWAPYLYLEHIPGKNVRSKYIEAFNSVLNAPPQVVASVIKMINSLHTTSLLMDDIEDSAVLRRGKPVAHSIFGMPRTINTANFVMIQTLRDATTEFPDAQSIIYDEILALHEGQGLELYWRDTHTCPSEDQYMKMVSAKTSGLYRLGVRILQHYSSSKLDLVPLANCLGLLYQIQDDYLNLVSAQYKENKGFAEDITEGKFSFPVIHSLRCNNATASELSNILKLHTKDEFLKRHALEILRSTKSLEYTRTVISLYVDRAHTLISELRLSDPSILHDLVRRMTLVESPEQLKERSLT